MQLFKIQPVRPTRSAFTLVEMLVSVTLVLLMMTMFASIFQVAMNSFKTQQAIGESDQNIRSITTVLRADFAKSTMTYALPFYPTEDVDLGPKSPGAREGYVYISTNDSDCRYDDILQMTIRSNLVKKNQDTTEYFGACQPLVDRQAGATGVNLYQNPNQPEVDDGSLSADFASSSPAAQVAYFVRNGNLYRRVVLIRNPRRVAGGDLKAQPTSAAGNNLFQGVDSAGPPNYDGRFQVPTVGLTNDFHRFFDFSAIAAFPVPGQQTAGFVGIEALSNKLTASGAAFEAFGNPVFRFGFNQVTGFSREHDSNTRRNFIGRLTHAETSAPNFNFPMNIMVAKTNNESSLPLTAPYGNGNPYDLVNTAFSLRPGNDLVDQLNTGGTRPMEDLLLANVHEFTVEIWDERAGRFVVPGYGSTTDRDVSEGGTHVLGDFHIRRCLHADTGSGRFSYGPLAPYNVSDSVEVNQQPHVFDTWHPALNVVGGGGGGGIDFDGDGTVEMSEIQAPYTPYMIYPPRQNDAIPGPSSPLAPAVAQGTNLGFGLTYQGYWNQGSNYIVGDVVYARINAAVPGWDGNADGAFHWLTDVVSPPVIPAQGFQIAYRCIQPGEAGPTPPNWPDTPGKRVSESGTVGTPAVWESFDNRRPLTSVRLTIRFINQKSGEPRQLTLVLPLTNT